ncbi:hypothetical protein ACN4DS_11110, partial [Corynebacterium macclintockiae]
DKPEEEWRVRNDVVTPNGKVTVRYASRLYQLGIGRKYTGETMDLTPMWWTPDIQPSRAGKKGNLPPCPGTPNSSNAMP